MLMAVDTNHTSAAIGMRLRAERKQQKISLRELARRIGSDPNIVSRLETGKRKMSVEWLSTLSDALGLRAAELLEPVSPEERVLVKAGACCNIWKQDCWYGPDQRYAIKVPPDSRYPGSERFAVEALCQAMNKRHPAGALVICVPLDAAAGGVEIGKRYLIESRRVREGVQESELTLKTLIIDNNKKLRLASESTEPDHQTTLPMFGSDDREVHAIASVIGTLQPE